METATKAYFFGEEEDASPPPAAAGESGGSSSFFSSPRLDPLTRRKGKNDMKTMSNNKLVVAVLTLI
jgi:hypothetical protein